MFKIDFHILDVAHVCANMSNINDCNKLTYIGNTVSSNRVHNCDIIVVDDVKIIMITVKESNCCFVFFQCENFPLNKDQILPHGDNIAFNYDIYMKYQKIELMLNLHTPNQIFIGYGVGGCLAAIAAYHFKRDFYNNVLAITFGMPPCMNIPASQWFKENIDLVRIKIDGDKNTSPVKDHVHAGDSVVISKHNITVNPRKTWVSRLRKFFRKKSVKTMDDYYYVLGLNSIYFS